MRLDKSQQDLSVVQQNRNEFGSKCPFLRAQEGVDLTNFASGKKTTDILHSLSKPIKCSEKSCKGALMSGQSQAPGYRPEEEVLEEAFNFQKQYFAFLKNSSDDDFQNRMNEIKHDVAKTGTYFLTYEELVFGAKLAWRNAPRCIGRIQWNKLEVQDCRNITSTAEMFEALCRHMKYGTNEGNLKSMITVFPQRMPGREDFRLWNPQLVNFAGYLQSDGTIVGDPARLHFTRICQRLGWKGKGGRFDVLPWILSGPGEEPKFYEIPEDLILMVQLEHPKYEWFSELGLRWYALPAVADMMLDVGGIAYTAAPFNGWYMATEVGARNLCDVHRYNISEEIAQRMGLDTTTPATLWKDKALIETTIAVLHSYQKNKVTIMDHHTAAETFMTHMETEQKLRGGCPADWVWIVPPISGSATPVFHQEMINYNLKPSYQYQEKAWITYKWPQNNNIQLKYKLASISRVVHTCVCLISKVIGDRVQATILFATETGKSKTFANKLGKVLQSSFNTKVTCMNDYDCKELLNETFLIIVASTFGSGEPPDNGKVFWDTLKKMKERKIAFKNLKYAVFALGSSHYPHFCKFGKDVDQIFAELGGERLMPIELSDELRGQEHTFNKWLPELYKTSCQDFRLESVDELLIPDMNVSSTWKKDHFRFEIAENKERDIVAELAKLHNKKLFSMKILSKTKLQASYSDRQTLLIRLGASDPSKLNYEPGDHIAIFPTNPSAVVNAVLRRIKKSEINCDDVIELESFQGGMWKPFDRLPSANLRTYLKSYLDITTPPTSSLLYHLSEMASNPWDKYRLKRLSEVTDDYHEWKSYKYPHLAEVLEEFPSIHLDPTLLVSELPLLQPRYYSISSSKLANSNEVHITVTLVSYRMQDNKGPVHQGVCTSYLNSFPTEEIPCCIRSATRFRLPEDPMVPVIMVGAGSGIAPFRSFWQERDALIRKQQSENKYSKQCFGAMYLFFGCRQSIVDNLYNEELATLVQEGVITGVFTVFSREPGQPKVYVQHRLKKESKLVLDSVAEGGHIYVCGDAVMAADVRSAFESILLGGNAITIDKLQENGRYHEDVFGILHRK